MEFFRIFFVFFRKTAQRGNRSLIWYVNTADIMSTRVAAGRTNDSMQSDARDRGAFSVCSVKAVTR